MDNIATVDKVIQAGREHRQDMARWLALEVLMTDEPAQQDDALQDHLSLLQGKVEERLRAKAAVS
jgi:hypothetical protein